MPQPEDSALVEITHNGYTVKTSEMSPGQKVTCPNKELDFEKLEDGRVKITTKKPGMRITGP